MEAQQPTTDTAVTPVNTDPLDAQNLDPVKYEDLLPYLLMPMAGYW